MIRIAIVEDIDVIREGLSLIINKMDEFTCEATFTNGEEALLELPLLEVDIVIMDIHLPGISGIECIRKVKSLCPTTQFMMFSVYDDDENVFEALKAGASGYLLKNTSSDKIADAIRDLHNGGSPMSSFIARKLVHSFHPSTVNDKANNSSELSSREFEVITLLSKGLIYKEIADRLSITTGTVKQHLHNIYEKLHVQNKTEAINKVFNKT